MSEDDIIDQLMAFNDRCAETENRLNDVLAEFNEGMISNQQGLANVYAKFLTLEKRQQDIEDMLKSDRIVELVKNIPTDQDIRDMLCKVEQTDVSKLAKNVKRIRNDLEELLEKFS